MSDKEVSSPPPEAITLTDQLVPHDSRDLVKAVAEDIGRELAYYIEIMYPEAVKAASSTFLLSVRNHTYNQIMAAIESDQNVEVRLAFREKFRRHIRAAYRKIRRQENEQ